MIERIVIVNDLAEPKGGASQLAFESAKSFADRGFPVTMLTGDAGPSPLLSGIEGEGLGQSRLLEGNSAKSIVRGIYNSAARTMVANWIAANDTPRTVYHIHGWSQILSSSIFGALDQVRGRIVMSAHDFFVSCPNGAAFDYRLGKPCHRRPMSAACVMARCDRRAYSHKLWRTVRKSVQDRMIGLEDVPPQLLIHRGMAEFFALAGIDSDHVAVLPNPIIPYTPDRIHAETNSSALFVGRMEATKGIDLAAQACRAAHVKLVALGSGVMLDQLRKDYPEMDFVGRVEPNLIGDYARKARMLLMPSRHMEPFGLSAVEALWSGLPVISSDQALISSDIEIASAGISVDPVDIGAFSRAIGELSVDDRKVRAMSVNAFGKTAGLALAPDQWIDHLLEAYLALLDGGRSGLKQISKEWASGAPDLDGGNSNLPGLVPCA